MIRSPAQADAVGVTFLPDSRRVEVAAASHLLLGAWKAGVGIKSVCGGRGKCGTCLVERGERPADGRAVAASTAGGTRICCRAPTTGSALSPRLHGARCTATSCVSVPPESQALKNPPRKPYTVTARRARGRW